jgi:hypothetical protein
MGGSGAWCGLQHEAGEPGIIAPAASVSTSSAKSRSLLKLCSYFTIQHILKDRALMIVRLRFVRNAEIGLDVQKVGLLPHDVSAEAVGSC